MSTGALHLLHQAVTALAFSRTPQHLRGNSIRLRADPSNLMARGNQRDRDRLKAQAKDAKKAGKNSKDGDPRARAERSVYSQ